MGPVRDALPTVPVGRCPVCGAGEATTLFEAPDFLHGVPGRFRYRSCGRCRSAYQDPRVRDDGLPRLYPGGYYTHSPPPPGGAPEPTPVRRLRDRLREGVVAAVRREGGAPWWGRLGGAVRPVRERAFRDLPDPVIPRSTEPGRALEIGPGSGEALALLRWAGWEAEGIEWDPDAARVAAERSGRPVRTGDFMAADLDEGAYDLVYLSHVLEHLPDPAAALERIRALLKPGTGRAVLVHPNLHSLGARRFGRAWYPWDPPRHLVLPSVPGIVEIAGRVGLRARVTTRSATAHRISARSRARRAGEGAERGRVGPGDRLFHLLEGILVAMGVQCGEEQCVVLRRAGDE